IVFSFLPMRFHAWLDGMMIAVPLVLVANISGLMELIDQRYRVFVVIVSFVLLMRFFCSGVWHRLPFNIVLKDSASSVVDVPLEVVRTRLDPNQTDDPADRAYFHGEILNELGEVSAQIEKSSDDEFTIREDFAGKGQYRETRFALKADGQSTEINIRTELTKLAPLAYWELWARPYAADYLDHLTARLANSRDRSAYGMCVARFRKAHDKKRAKILKARAT
ncbi:MAG: hypothetical protein OXQ30_05260, partial [Boseongicola sp.]|nr:hypothetical protein [Boseongicola sp.]